ncbi:hypothetical protein SMICM17S_12777 [Streptomyces microflavus]
MRCYVFPGQGTQKKGMGRNLFGRFPDLPRRADRVLGYPIEELCLGNPERRLSETVYAQPAIYVVNALHWSAAQEDLPPADFFAGHSLGEYSALFAAGAFDFETGLTLVQRRAELMGQVSGGAMAAVIGLSEQIVEETLKQHDATGVVIANYNAPEQFVLSGSHEELARIKSVFEKVEGVRGFVPVRVSGPFHAPAMAPAAARFRTLLASVDLGELRTPVISNVTGRPFGPDVQEVRALLAEQIAKPVRWTRAGILRHRYGWWRGGVLEGASATPSSSGWRSGPPISGARATIRRARGGRTPGSRSGRPSRPPSPHGTGVPSRGSSRPAGPSRSGARTRKDPSGSGWRRNSESGDGGIRPSVSIFQLACKEEMQQLAADYPRMIRLRHPFVRAHGTLTRTSLRLNRDVWAPLRLAWAHEDAGSDRMELLENPLSWPSSADTLARGIRSARGGLRGVHRWLSPGWRLWQDNYNAACVYAVAMNGTRGQSGSQERRALADLAVDELEGVGHADVSGFHPVTRSWLLIEDPDMEKLRQESRFIRFERETYPHAAPDRHRPERPLRPEMKAYGRQLLSGCAAVMEHTWRLRRGQLPAEPYVLSEWFVGEAELWRCVERIASNQGRNWRDRERLLQRVREVADRRLLVRCGLPSRLPEMDDLLDEAAWDTVDGVQERIRSFEETFEKRLSALSLAVAVGANGSANRLSPIRLSTQWLAAVRQNGASAAVVKQAAAQQACSDYETAWRAVRDLLDPDQSATALSDALQRFHVPQGMYSL